MNEVKTKITQLVENYKEMFGNEFQAFLRAQKPKTDALQKENKFAELEGSQIIERQLGEMPETLFFMLQNRLGAEEYTWYQSKPGQIWFYNNFKEFKVTRGRV